MLHDQARFPTMRQMRRIEPLQTKLSDLHKLAVTKDTSLTIGDIVYGQHRKKVAAQWDCMRSDGEELIKGTALVSLEMGERDPSQALESGKTRVTASRTCGNIRRFPV